MKISSHTNHFYETVKIDVSEHVNLIHKQPRQILYVYNSEFGPIWLASSMTILFGIQKTENHNNDKSLQYLIK